MIRYATNRHLALISATFPKALEWGRVDRNPAAGVKAFRKENLRQRFLTLNEIGRLFAAMEAEPNQTAVPALTLALFTGARREEVLQARWEHVDLQGGQWWPPKTKNGHGRDIALSDEAKALLAAQPSLGTSPWVFPERFGDKPLNKPRETFCRVLAAAGVEHLRIHDLRHSFASLEVNAGATLHEVQDLLGHSSAQMTQRYAHLADAGRKRVVGKVGAVVTAAVRQAAGDEEDKAAWPPLRQQTIIFFSGRTTMSALSPAPGPHALFHPPNHWSRPFRLAPSRRTDRRTVKSAIRRRPSRLAGRMPRQARRHGDSPTHGLVVAVA